MSPAIPCAIDSLAPARSGFALRYAQSVSCASRRLGSFATHLLESGVSIQQLSQYLGHSDLNSTMIYLHVTEVSETKGRAAQSELYRTILAGSRR